MPSMHLSHTHYSTITPLLSIVTFPSHSSTTPLFYFLTSLTANPSQTLSVHVGITPEGVEMKDVERGAVDHSPPVALHSALTTVLHPNSFEVNGMSISLSLSLVIFTILLPPPPLLLSLLIQVTVRLRFLRLPGLKAWVACFGPVLMLSLLSSFPFYVAIGRPNKSIQACKPVGGDVF